MERVKSVRDALDAPALAWESWWLNGLWPRTRAYPLAGGAAAWDEEVTRQPGVPSAHAIFSGEPPPKT
jgi:hypothetical protein